MDERQLRAFVLIAEIGRMDLAAKELGYSQPAISYQIRGLEQSLGARLFTRDSTGTRLTAEGQMILPSVRALLILIDNIREAASRPPGSLTDSGGGSPPDNVTVLPDRRPPS